MNFKFFIILVFKVVKASNLAINITEQIINEENHCINGVIGSRTDISHCITEQNNVEDISSTNVLNDNDIYYSNDTLLNNERNQNTYMLVKNIMFKDLKENLSNETVFDFHSLFFNEIELLKKEIKNDIYEDPKFFYPKSIYNKNFLTIASRKHNIISEELLLNMLREDPLMDIKVECFRKLIDTFYGLFYHWSWSFPCQLLTQPYNIVDEINVLSFMPHLLSTFIERHFMYCNNYNINLENAKRTFKKQNNTSLLFKLSTVHGLAFENYFKDIFYKNINIFRMMQICDILFIREIFYIFYIVEINIAKLSYLIDDSKSFHLISPDFTNKIFKNTGCNSFFISFNNIMGPLTRLSTNKIEDIIDVNKFNSNIDISDFTEPINNCSDLNNLKRFFLNQGTTATMPHAYIDILLGMINLVLAGINQIVIIKVKRISNRLSRLEIVETTKDGYIRRLKKYYKKCYRNDRLFKKDLKGLIKEDKCRHFSSIESLSTYTFEKNNNACFSGGFYRLNCGHFIGLDLKKQFFDNLKHKCVLCNEVVGIQYYFKAKVYIIDEDNEDITLKKI